MINVTLDEAKMQKEKPFPKLMIHKTDRDFIVLMSEPEEGAVIWSKWAEYLPGYYSDKWDMQALIDYNEPITLQND